MMYVFGFSLLVVAAATVVLFAMLGELYARTGATADERDTHRFVRPLTEARVGARPGSWPAGLSHFETAPHGVVIVLSTACGSCEDVAAQLDTGEDPAAYGELAVLLSTGDPAKADEFLARHPLGGLRPHVDHDGAWVTTEFGVRTSPTALIFQGGRLASALVFSDIAVLRPAVRLEKEQV